MTMLQQTGGKSWKGCNNSAFKEGYRGLEGVVLLKNVHAVPINYFARDGDEDSSG